MFHSASMLYGHQLTPTSINRNSGTGDPPDSNSGHQQERPAMKLLHQSTSSITNKTPNKILVHVNVERSFGPVHVVLLVENTVEDLIRAVIELYLKERRRPLMVNTDARCFDLHYSQFSLQRLEPEEKLINLESRNFFLCPKPSSNNNNNTTTFSAATNSSSCFDESKTTTKTVTPGIHLQMLPIPYTKFMEFLL